MQMKISWKTFLTIIIIIIFKHMEKEIKIFLFLFFLKREMFDNGHIRLYLDGFHIDLACWKHPPRGVEKKLFNLIFITPLSSALSHSQFRLEATACHSTFLPIRDDFATQRVGISRFIADMLARPDVRRREKMRPALDFNPMEF